MTFKVKKITAEQMDFNAIRESNPFYKNETDEEILARANYTLSEAIRKNETLGFHEVWGINNEV